MKNLNTFIVSYDVHLVRSRLEHISCIRKGTGLCKDTPKRSIGYDTKVARFLPQQ